MNKNPRGRSAVEARFAEVFEDLGFIAGYARRRGARDPDGIAAETMAVAWRRLADVPADDARPWLIATARNLLLAERRREPAATRDLDGVDLPAPEQQFSHELDLDPDLAAGLRALSDQDRETLLLIAWDDLTPAQAADSLGITSAAFRVRLHRARRRLSAHLTERPLAASISPSRPNWKQT
jgi:RNA polymerase sigma-70 factor (ECF subfamily)